VKPIEGSDLPQISKGRLTTTKALKVFKLAAFVISKLGVDLPLAELPEGQEPTPGQSLSKIPATDYVIISCKGKVRVFPNIGKLYQTDLGGRIWSLRQA